MKRFAQLLRDIDASTRSSVKQAALVAYLQDVPMADAAWAVYLLAGGKTRQAVSAARLKRWAMVRTGLAPWLFEACYEQVGDLAETLSLLLPPASGAAPEESLHRVMQERILALRGLSEEEQAAQLDTDTSCLSAQERLAYFKLITGSFRSGISRLGVLRALSAYSGVPHTHIAQRFMGMTQPDVRPSAADFAAWVAQTGSVSGAAAHETSDPSDPSLPTAWAMPQGEPYPFFLAHPWGQDEAALFETLSDLSQWLVEWKWDGIRAQIVRRGAVEPQTKAQAPSRSQEEKDAQGVWIWSRGEELVSDRFPELCAACAALPPGTVLDGEILAGLGEQPQPFAVLQTRLGRKRVSAALQARMPVHFMAYDVLEWQGQDWRDRPLSERRAVLERIVSEWGSSHLRISPRVQAANVQALAALRQSSRERGVEGFMLKHLHSRYGVGRTQSVGVWWKWKIDPMHVDAVLVYAQRGHGRRAGLYTDYTFAVWDAEQALPTDGASAPTGSRGLVPFAKAYSGLTDAEIKQVDALIRKTTRESFGPVRSVEPTLVFEIGFEGISRSPRHKSGIAVRFPRILRWRHDKPIAEADTLDHLQALLSQNAGGAAREPEPAP